MNTPHYKELEVPGSKPGKARLNWGRWLLVSILTLILLFAALGWLGRKYIAHQALVQWCHDQSLACEARIDRLGPGGAVISGVRVRSGDDVPFAADEVMADITWQGLVPSVGAVSIRAPELRGTLDDRGIRFYGLETLGASGGGGNGALPPVKISKGRVTLATSAGEIGASVDLEGEFPKSGTLQMTLDPVSLSGPEGTLIWSEGRVDIIASDGQLEGEAFLDLAEADVRGVQARNVQLTALLNSPLSGAGDSQLVWDGTLASASWAGYAVSDAVTSGRAILDRLPSSDIGAVLDSLVQASSELRADKLSGSAFAGRMIALEFDLQGEAGRVTGPVLASAQDLEILQGRAQAATIRGSILRSAEDGIGFKAEVSTSGTVLNADTTGQLLDFVNLPGMFAAHEASLTRALQQALAAFDATVSVDARRRVDGWTVSTEGPAQLTARSGLAVDIAPGPDGRWLSMAGSDLAVTGHTDMTGGGLPALSADLALEAGAAGLSRFTATELALSAWPAGGRTLSADLKRIDFERTGEGNMALEASGRIGVSGNVSGFDLATTSLAGKLFVSSDPDGWRISTPDRACLTLNSQGVRFGAVSLGAFQTPLCPQGKDFIARGDGFAGATRLGDLSLPIAFSSSSGTVRFSNASIDWTGGKTASVSAVSDTVSLALDIGEQTLGINGDGLRLGIATRANAAPALSARLGETRFDGSLIPANVASSDFRFDGTTGAGGVQGSMSADGVTIRDYRDDPLYQPLTADFDATLDGTDFTLSGPLRLASNGLSVADTLLRLDVSKLSGMAAIDSRDLQFEPGALQPWRLSERLRGVFTDARGGLAASARFDIVEGRIEGEGEVSVSDFGFQTTRLGRVQGVNGTVAFTELLALTTGPGQVISVERLNPGVPLENGQIAFQLVGGTQFKVESAAFPFAGGTLALPAFDWLLGAEKQNIEVTAEAIELTELVDVLKLPNTRASGTVSGRFPINIDGTNIFVRDARLKADAEGGHISYQGSAGDSASEADPNAKMAFEALKDFDFTVLELGLDGNVRDRMTISLILEGKSRKGIAYGDGNQVLTGQPFLFNITVNSALGELLRNTQYYTSQKSLTDAVVKQVQAKRLDETE
ncbi:MAG: YdbH domain-containing protein [Hyphomonas sp.]|nr:YdbH domain-containing protein [Hyphomonas sp.]